MARYSGVVAARRARMSAGTQEQAKVFNRGAALAADVLALRLARGWTQTELAERSGIDQADISRIERGLSNATEATLGRLAEVLDAEIHMTPREPLSVCGLSPDPVAARPGPLGRTPGPAC